MKNGDYGVKRHIGEKRVMLPFKSVLMENSNLKWNSPERIDRLAGLLRQKGLKIKSVKSVVISAPYYASKSFLGPVEALEMALGKRNRPFFCRKKLMAKLFEHMVINVLILLFWL